MPWNLPSRSLSCPLVAAALSLACALPAWAGGSHDDARAKPAAAAKDAAESDPTGALRQKLAERLGAQKPADPRNANVVRVDNRATAPVPPAGLSAAANASGSLTLSSAARARPAAAKNTEPAPE